MGVLACDRNGCENIMCDRYSDEYGYLCDECFEELVGRGPTIEISEFMMFRKSPARKQEATARYDAVFPIRSSLRADK